MERLETAGGVDDRRYARLFAADRRALDGWGEERIRAVLETRGVAGPLIDEALAAGSDDSEIERAMAQLQRRGEDLRDEASRGRAYGFLVRRGYASELAYDAVRRAEAGRG